MTHPVGLTFAAALAEVVRAGFERRLPAQRTALSQARGAVLAEAITAPLSLPPFDNSAMDGFAFRGASLDREGRAELRLIATRFAGSDAPIVLGDGECVRITTGALLPEGADTVVIKEHARLEGDLVHITHPCTRGANIRRAGEDVAAGTHLFDAGSTLTPVAIGMLASLGFEGVPVAPRPSVAVFTSGDELRPPGSVLAPGEIYDSNRLLLQSLLAEEGIATLAWPALPDDAERIGSALADASEAYDLILTCGGVSAGEKDLLPGLLAKHGRIRFWKVRMRPGMPVLFGEWNRALVLGLPGNPVSVLATFRRLALPLLDAMQGRSDRAPALRALLGASLSKSHDRLEFRRGRLACDAQGQLRVSAHAATGSHQQRGALESNALIVLDADARELAAGTLVEVEPYGAILRT
jgi:molybdopterin molybdotransferase